MKLFLKRNGCAPCRRVKESIDMEKLSGDCDIVFLDEVSPSVLENYKAEHNLQTVPTLITEEDFIADSVRIIKLLEKEYA